MNQPPLLERKRSVRKTRWLQASLLVMASLLASTGVAEALEPYQPESRDSSFGLDLAAKLEAPQDKAYGLGDPGLLYIETDDNDNTSDAPVIAPGPSSKLDRRTLGLSKRPLDFEKMGPGVFPQLGDEGFSKSWWGVHWRLSLVESADRDGQL
jgi:hypothetical protein